MVIRAITDLFSLLQLKVRIVKIKAHLGQTSQKDSILNNVTHHDSHTIEGPNTEWNHQEQ